MKTNYALLRRTIFFVLTIFSLGFFTLESEDHIGNKSDEQSISFEYYAFPDSSVDKTSNNQDIFFGSVGETFDFEGIDTNNFEYWNSHLAPTDVFEDWTVRQYQFVDGEEVVGDFQSSSSQYLEGKMVRPYTPSPWPCEEFEDCKDDGVSPYVPSPWPCEELGDCAEELLRPHRLSYDYTKDGFYKHLPRGF